MGKDGVLKGIIGLQAVCMIVLAVFVVVRLLPKDPVSVPATGKLDAAVGLGSLAAIPPRWWARIRYRSPSW